MSLTNTINYVTPSNFTLSNSDEIEVSGSVLILKELATLQGSELFYIPFTTAEEFVARRKTGSVITETEEAPGNIDYSSGIAQLPGAQLDYWGVPLDNFVPSTANDFEISFKWKAPYSGAPAVAHDFFVIKETTDNNRLVINHAKTTGALSFTIWDSSGVYKGQPSAVWVPVSGQTYTMTLAFGPTTQTLFIDGVSHATQTVSAISINNPSSGTITIGSDRTKDSQGGYSQFVLYDGVQHSGTTTFTPADPVQYSSNNPTALVNAVTTADSLTAFSEVAASKTGSDEFKYAITVNSQDKYWDGAAWSNSSSYSQANTATEINTNISALDISAGKSIQVKTFVHSDDGQTTPSLTSNSFSYGFFNVATTPSMCTISGEVVNLSGNPVEGARIEITNVSGTPYLYDSALVAKAAKTYTDEDGKFEIPLIETATDAKTVDIKAYFYDLAGMEVTKTLASAVTIPNQSSASIEDLV